MQSQFLKTLLSLLAESSDSSLDLDALARKTGYSKYHLCRAFHAATNEPLQTYLRRLRLARGAEALRKGKRVLDVALDCGYQSQEAFHRAFIKMFGITPRQLQTGQHHPSLLLKQPWREGLMPPPALPCRDEEMPGLTLFGMGGIFSYDQIPQIVELWQRFHRRFPQRQPTFGVTLKHPEDPFRFRYFAACEAGQTDSHDGLEPIVTPPQRYKVFHHKGPAESLLQAFNYIWGVWLPEQSEWTLSGVDFERYPPGYDPESASSWMEIFIPVERRGMS